MMKLLLVISSSFFFGLMSLDLLEVVFFISVYMVLCFSLFFNYSMSLGADCWIMISGYLAYDSLSYYLVLLSVWILMLMMLSLLGEGGVLFKVLVFNLVLVFLILFFSVFSFMLLYFFFEVSMIPTFLIVFLWGGNKERVGASFFLLLYMMFISFPFLAYMFKAYMVNLSLDMSVISLKEFNEFGRVMGCLDLMIFLGAFLIKLPMYMVHLWLPKAHLEAPVYGSMLLAAVLLKLGGYGLLRVSGMFMEQCNYVSTFLVSAGLLGSFYVSILCLTQADMKSLVAYSSVVHMNFMLCSLFTLTKMGVISTVLVMLSHGLCSSGLFYMVNMIYKRSISRLLILNRGFLSFTPLFSFWWFVLCASNFAFPFSLNFVGEIMVIMVLMGWSVETILMMSGVSFFSGAYSLYMFSLVYHGGGVSESKGGLMECSDLVISQGEYLIEHLSLFLHYYPLLVMMLNLSIYMC